MPLHSDSYGESEISHRVQTELCINQKYVFEVERVKFIQVPTRILDSDLLVL